MLRMEAEFLEQLIAISTHKNVYNDGKKFSKNNCIIFKVYDKF